MNKVAVERALAAWLRAYFEATGIAVEVRESQRAEVLPVYEPHVTVSWEGEAEHEVGGCWTVHVGITVSTPALVPGADPQAHDDVARAVEAAWKCAHYPAVSLALAHHAGVICHGSHRRGADGGQEDGKWLHVLVLRFGLEQSDALSEWEDEDVALALEALAGLPDAGPQSECLFDLRDSAGVVTAHLPSGGNQRIVALAGSFEVPGGSPGLRLWFGDDPTPLETVLAEPGAVLAFSRVG